MSKRPHVQLLLNSYYVPWKGCASCAAFPWYATTMKSQTERTKAKWMDSDWRQSTILALSSVFYSISERDTHTRFYIVVRLIAEILMHAHLNGFSVAVVLWSCVGGFMWHLFSQYLFLISLSEFMCLGKAVLRNCTVSWVSLLMNLNVIKRAFWQVHKRRPW